MYEFVQSIMKIIIIFICENLKSLLYYARNVYGLACDSMTAWKEELRKEKTYVIMSKEKIVELRVNVKMAST